MDTIETSLIVLFHDKGSFHLEEGTKEKGEEGGPEGF
jgi:hypothetical protein